MNPDMTPYGMSLDVSVSSKENVKKVQQTSNLNKVVVNFMLPVQNVYIQVYNDTIFIMFIIMI